ncbi:MAG: ABC transporter ATP-binding protein, partial [Clostridium sp.]|uniref:ABC transporter ATP-binding protein n=1 Tax=Clostridium sp. TaxID=1506 RepID=UPI003EE463B5
ISIVGESGSGKTTLLKLCAHLISCSSGKIKFNGREYSTYDDIELRKNIRYCVQEPYLFGERVKENLEFPFKIRKEKVDDRRIEDLLQIFNLDKEIIHKKIEDLSGGEKQRIALVRSVIYEPKVILLDEATSALDEKNTEKVERYIKNLNEKGITVLWNTHDTNQSKRIFNKRIVLEMGKIKEVEKIYG